MSFKAGDWVRHIDSNNIYRVNGFSVHGQTKGWLQVPDEDHLIPSTECELWQPKENEWCWFWNGGDLVPKFGSYWWNKDNSKGLNPRPYVSYSLNCAFQYCEPFTNQLPSLIKDK